MLPATNTTIKLFFSMLRFIKSKVIRSTAGKKFLNHLMLKIYNKEKKGNFTFQEPSQYFINKRSIVNQLLDKLRNFV